MIEEARVLHPTLGHSRDSIFDPLNGMPGFQDPIPNRRRRYHGHCIPATRQPSAHPRRGGNQGNDKTYDQIAFAPTALRDRVENHGVFDFDGAVFASKWKALSRTRTKDRTVKEFNKYLRHYLSDHRPVWVEIRTNNA